MFFVWWRYNAVLETGKLLFWYFWAVARLPNYSHFKVEIAKMLKEDRTKKSGLSSNCLFLVVIDFDFLDPSYIIADGVFFHLQELGDFFVGIAGILQSANISQLRLIFC